MTPHRGPMSEKEKAYFIALLIPLPQSETVLAFCGIASNCGFTANVSLLNLTGIQRSAVSPALDTSL